MALKKSMLVDVEKENLCVPIISKEVLQAPAYKERMMMKKEENRKRRANKKGSKVSKCPRRENKFMSQDTTVSDGI